MVCTKLLDECPLSSKYCSSTQTASGDGDGSSPSSGELLRASWLPKVVSGVGAASGVGVACTEGEAAGVETVVGEVAGVGVSSSSSSSSSSVGVGVGLEGEVTGVRVGFGEGDAASLSSSSSWRTTLYKLLFGEGAAKETAVRHAKSSSIEMKVEETIVVLGRSGVWDKEVKMRRCVRERGRR